MRRIEKITGRTDDLMIVRGVNVYPTQIEEIVLRTPELTPHFQCHLERTGNLDTLLVRIERRADVTPHAATAAGERVGQLVKRLVGVTIGVEVVDPESIERSVGKMRRIVDHRRG